MDERENLIEYAALAAADTGEYDVEVSLAELKELARTLDIETAAVITQRRDDLDRATCIGRGKLEELKSYIERSEISLVIFDHELSATQLRNIEEICGVPVLDRTMLILEIFAQRAMSGEGKLQVELARDRYLLPRLSGLGQSLSRLGGGGGGAGAGARRGKGETKLELDRRHIRRRIQLLERQLTGLTKRRDELRRRRKKDGVISVAIVGYTNVGKSTLLNALTDAGVLVEDKLFATLDPTARALTLPDGRSAMLIDTVGLIRRLPHHLVEAFKSTLEEAAHASLLLNVCDASSEDSAVQAEVTRELLKDMGVTDTPVLTVLNKCDKLASLPRVIGENSVLVSAKTGYGFDELLSKAAKLLSPTQRRMRLLIPYGRDALLAEIRREGKVLSQEFVEAGTLIDALVEQKIIHRVAAFEIEK
jgi:GTP-binding protein HflX